MNFKNILLFFYFMTILLSCITSLFFIGVKTKPVYMKYFFWYPTITFLIMLNRNLSEYNYIDYMTNEIKYIIVNLSFILHYILLALFIKHNILASTKINNYLPSLFWLFLFLIGILLFSSGLTVKNGLAYGVTNFCLLIFCVIYFQQLFKNPPTVILIHSPAFWVVNGIFFGMTTTIPINFSGDFFIKDGNEESIQILRNLGSVSYIIMHLFFIKAYLCIVRPNKVL